VHCFCCWEYSSSAGEAARRHRRRRRHRRQKIIFVCLLFLRKRRQKREIFLFFFLFFCGCFSVEEDISLLFLDILKISPSFSLFSLSETRVVPSYFPRRTFTFTFKTHKYHHYVIGYATNFHARRRSLVHGSLCEKTTTIAKNSHRHSCG